MTPRVFLIFLKKGCLDAELYVVYKDGNEGMERVIRRNIKHNLTRYVHQDYFTTALTGTGCLGH